MQSMTYERTLYEKGLYEKDQWIVHFVYLAYSIWTATFRYNIKLLKAALIIDGVFLS